MTFTVEAWPNADDLDRYETNMPGIPRADIVRDIVRIVSIAKMVSDGTLNDDWVLCGGMAMRLRGSPRFTRLDTDTSRRAGVPDDSTLAMALRLDEDVLSVEAAGFNAGVELVTVMPVEFTAYFAALGEAPQRDSFSFTVSGRGLIETAERLMLIHPYPELVLPATTVPVMDLTEQIAEKICGWCIHGLVKHYVDVAWAFLELPGEIRAERLGPLVQKKLSIGKELFPAAYAKVPTLKEVLTAMNNPKNHVAPLGKPDDKRTNLRFSEPAFDYDRATQIVRKSALPALLTAAVNAAGL
jgi:hypothetical protein